MQKHQMSSLIGKKCGLTFVIGKQLTGNCKLSPGEKMNGCLSCVSVCDCWICAPETPVTLKDTSRLSKWMDGGSFCFFFKKGRSRKYK